jgi:phosphate transport system protein
VRPVGAYGDGMREEFRADLAAINRNLVTMSGAVQAAMSRATSALLDANETDAEEVIAADAEIDAYYRIIEDKVYDVLARQAPVAGDLRLVITSLHAAADLERMGAVAAPLTAQFKEMGVVAERIAGKITKALRTHDVVAAAQLDRDDDAMDELHEALFTTMFGPDWSDGVAAAVDAALLGRYYERYADHAVNVGRHVVFLVTGESMDSDG